MRGYLWIVLVVPFSCAPAKPEATQVAPKPALSSSPPPAKSVQVITVVASASAPPAPVEPPPCAHVWASDAPAVAVAWNECGGEWFVVRGLPAISKDGKRIAIPAHEDLNAKATVNLRIQFDDVDSGKTVQSSKLLEALEFDEPDPPNDAAKKMVLARIGAANAKLEGFVPMTACAEPAPWPSAGMGYFEGCTASPRPAQTMACGDRVIVSAKPKRLSITADKKVAIDRDISSWSYAWDSNYTPGGKGKKDSVVHPHVAGTFVDEARGALLLRFAYCNTSDMQPRVPDLWSAMRIPKAK